MVYIRKGILRYVPDYLHQYKTYVKLQWENKTLISVLEKFMKKHNYTDYMKNIQQGKITVNQKQIQPDYILKRNDYIENTEIRKEPPVYHLKMQIIYEDDEILVIDKPSSIPVHPCSNYNYNTVTFILKNEMQYPSLYRNQLYNVNKIFKQKILDRLTSGILILAKTLKNRYSQLQQIPQKEYLARVLGNFQHDQEFYYEKPISLLNQDKKIYSVLDSQYLNCYPYKNCVTIFQKIWYDKRSDSSLIKCKPLTGRYHQIRIHLQSLGFPIVNDKLYGGKIVGNILLKRHIHGNEDFRQLINLDGFFQQNFQNMSEWTISDDKVMEIWLHSLNYHTLGKEFKSNLPYWAYPELDFQNID